jgi:cytochrome c oxidase assembly factor CtaG
VTLDAPFALAVVTAALYALGIRRRLRLVGSTSPQWRWRAACFYGGLALIVFVLGPAYDHWADELFWAHMLQHVVLTAAAPPLLLLGAPLMPLFRGLPLGFRRLLARRALRLPRAVYSALRLLRRPVPIFVLANVDLVVWHVPALYDLTLRSTVVHYTEHALFLVLGLLFWAQVLDSPPVHPKLDGLWRAVYLTGAAAVGWMLALVFALAQHPLYHAYASVQHRPGGLSALTDQQLAAGVMLGVGSIPYSIAVFVCLYEWLDDERQPRRLRRRAAASAG